jgi:hypothetical protein
MRLCSLAFNDGTFVPQLKKAALPVTKSGGEDWDIDGPPDPYAVLEIDAAPIGSTFPVADTLTPSWLFDLAPTAIARTASARIDVYDEDGEIDELVMSCSQVLAKISYGSFYDPTYFDYLCVPNGVASDAGPPSQSVEFRLTLHR